MKKYYTWVVTIFMVQFSSAQNKFNAYIKFPSNIDSRKVLLSYDNGKKSISPTISIKSNTFFFSGIYYSKYATITILYPKTKRSFYANDFFVKGEKASLSFINTKNDSLKNPLENSKSNNMIEIQKTREAKRLRAYTLQELLDIENYFAKNENEINSNDSILAIANKKSFLLAKKELEFVKSNMNSYFSFWIFRTRLINSFIDTNLSILIATFNEFPEKFTKSFEGKQVQKLLNGRNFTKQGFEAPDFVTKDILGNIIDLKGYRGKYVLLDFWASWCGPCLESVQFINNVRKLYPPEKLEIIGVSYDKDSTAFKNCIDKFNMNYWTHIYGDNDLINKYGNKPIPSLYLIDKKGIIIYSNWEDNKDKLDLLLTTLLGSK